MAKGDHSSRTELCGHQSVSVIRPHKTDDPYTMILHFDTVAQLRDWLDSETRVHLVQKVRPFLQTDEDVDIKTGFEFWFTPPPASRPAKPYKQFLITLSAIFPLTVAAPWLLQPLFQWAPLLGLPVIRHPDRRSHGRHHGDRFTSHAPLHAARGAMAVPMRFFRAR